MEQVTPQKKIRVGLIGCGRWGQNHAKTIATLPVDFVGVADLDPAKKDFVESLGTKFFGDHRALLREVDAVVIAAPTFQHFSVVKDALEAGRHVLVEKPVTLNSRDTEMLVRLAREKNLILSVGYLFRFHPVVRKLKEELRSIKNIHYLTARWIGGQNRLWQDSGAIINFGIHVIDILNFILEARPIKVYATKQNLLDPKREDSALVELVYPNFFAALELSCVHPAKARDLWLVGDSKKFFADFNAQTLTAYNFSIDAKGTVTGSVAPEIIEIPKGEPLADELRYFFDAVMQYNPDTYQEIYNIGREEPHTTKICERALEAALQGKELEIVYE